VERAVASGNLSDVTHLATAWREASARDQEERRRGQEG
jgi:hypothetical protein